MYRVMRVVYPESGSTICNMNVKYINTCTVDVNIKDSKLRHFDRDVIP